MSSDSSANPLSAYLAGQLTTEQFVAAVTAEYYGEPGAGSREKLRPLIDIIERAHPGIVHLSGNGERPGFAVRLAERPFPKRYEPELREAVARAVPASGSSLRAPGVWARILRAIRRVFSASA